jgi:exosortase C (VPDSG-CTERM-specific)
MSTATPNVTAATWRTFGLGVCLVSALSALPLVRLASFALQSNLQSHILLIPLISAYLLYHDRHAIFQRPASATDGRRIALFTGLAALALLALHAALTAGNRISSEPGALCLPVMAYITILLGAFLACFGRAAFHAALFPLLFLYVMVPIPDAAAHVMAVALQHGSATATHGLFLLTGTPVIRDGLTFHLPGLSLHVAEECSGIHSTLALLIASLVASKIYLQQVPSRVVLLLAVIPLCLLRNGFRVVSLALLTMHVDPGIMDSRLHHRGGPLFFALALLVFFALLLGLRIWEKRNR